MILSLTNDEPKLVRTESLCILQTNIADTATVHMEFKSGLKAHISVSWLHPYKEQKLVVIGQSGMVVFDDTKPWNEKLAFYRYSIDLTGKAADLNKSKVQYLEVPESEPLKNECQHFINVVNGRLPPLTDGDEGLRVLNVLSASTLSQSENSAVRIESL